MDFWFQSISRFAREIFEPFDAAEQISSIVPIAHGDATEPKPKTAEYPAIDWVFRLRIDCEALRVANDHGSPRRRRAYGLRHPLEYACSIHGVQGLAVREFRIAA
jgi:hypothetical protein